jgi:DNA-binding SARP family transcriptional activator/WD40 repeat protein
VRIAVIGPLEVRDGAGPITVPGAKERMLLALLAAAAPTVVSVDRLAEELWDGEPPATARKSLQAHVVRLRSALEPARPKGSSGRFVVRRGAGYALAVEREALDTLHFVDLAVRGRARLTAGDPHESEHLLRDAVALWRGEPYADWPDAPFAVAERRRLREVRSAAVTALLEARLAAGRHAEIVPELHRLVAEEPMREEWWRLLMLALYRAGRQAEALAAARRVRALRIEELGAEPGPALRQLEAAILAQDPALDDPRPPGAAAPAPVVDPATCPYKGLAAYQPDDASLFHGRSRMVARLTARLVDSRLLVVSGPSGAGKSSLVRAGLVPAIAAGALPGSDGWRTSMITPGLHPVDQLADLTGESPPRQPVLLVCDQFEQLWAPGAGAAERTAFLDALLGLLDDGVVARCVVVVRGDHIGRLAEHAPLAERVGAAVELVPPLTDQELREVVRAPADVVGLAVEPELVDAVLSDVLGRAGALPLLSTALVGTWERRRGSMLTLAGYVDAGGVGGALTRVAEQAYAGLGDEERQVARRLIVRLADTDDGGTFVRRSLRLAELGGTADEAARRRSVVETFVGRRLLAVDGDRVEVAHESLFTAWPRLAAWLAEDSGGRLVRRHLAPAAREWDAAGRPQEELYRGPRLAAALDWAARPDADPTALESAFLAASRARAEAELDEVREQVRRERRSRRRTRRLAIGLAAVLVLALVTSVLAVTFQRDAAERAGEAERNATIADANRLAALSPAATSLDLTLLLAAQATRLAGTPEAEDALLTALVQHQRARRAVAFRGTAQGGTLAAGGRTLFLHVGPQVLGWSVGSAEPARVVLDLTEDWLGWRTGSGSPTDDGLLAAGFLDGRIWLRSLTRDGQDRLLPQGGGPGGIPVALAYRPDGRTARLLLAEAGPDGQTSWRFDDVDPATGARRDTGVRGAIPGPPEGVVADLSDDGGTAVIWSEESGAALLLGADGHPTELRVPPRDAQSVAFRAFPSGAVQLWDDGGITRYDGSGAAVQQLDVHRAPVRDAVLAADGTWGVTVGDGGAVVVWDVDADRGAWSPREALVGHTADVALAYLTPDGDTLVTAGLDDTVIAWDMTGTAGFGAAVPDLDGRWVSNRPALLPDGALVAPTRPVGSTGGGRDSFPGPDTLAVAAAFIDPRTGRVLDQVPVGDTLEGVSSGSSVAVSPDGRLVAVTSGLATTVLDTRTRDVVSRIVLPPNGDTDDLGLPLPATIVWCAAWTPDGSHLLLGAEGDWQTSTGGALVVVDATTWQEERRVDIGATAQTIATSPDDDVLAVASAGAAEIRILDADTLELRRTVELREDDRLYDLAFSPDGGSLVGVGESGLIHVVETATWRAGEPVPVQPEPLVQVEWLDEGRTAVVAGENATVALFDVAAGLLRTRPLPTADPGRSRAVHLVPQPAAELILLGGERPGRRYPLDHRAWLGAACAVAARDLTHAEWARYLPGRPYRPTCSDLE